MRTYSPFSMLSFSSRPLSFLRAFFLRFLIPLYIFDGFVKSALAMHMAPIVIVVVVVVNKDVRQKQAVCFTRSRAQCVTRVSSSIHEVYYYCKHRDVVYYTSPVMEISHSHEIARVRIFRIKDNKLVVFAPTNREYSARPPTSGERISSAAIVSICDASSVASIPHVPPLSVRARRCTCVRAPLCVAAAHIERDRDHLRRYRRSRVKKVVAVHLPLVRAVSFKTRARCRNRRRAGSRFTFVRPHEPPPSVECYVSKAAGSTASRLRRTPLMGTRLGRFPLFEFCLGPDIHFFPNTSPVSLYRRYRDIQA